MTELTCLILSVLIWVAHVVIQGGFATTVFDTAYLASPRDDKREPRGVYFPRATRALANYVENFTAFAATDLGLIVTHHSDVLGPTIWIIARVVYIPLYIFGVPYLRTLAWLVSLAALLLMLYQLADF
jgi:uncharacterized MAPEG superfamily protein